MDSREDDLYIHLSVVHKGHKLVIQCQNTCAEDACLYKGLPKGKKKDSLGVTSIVKTAARYKGETDFLINNKSFYIRVLLNLPSDIKEKAQALL